MRRAGETCNETGIKKMEWVGENKNGKHQVEKSGKKPKL